MASAAQNNMNDVADAATHFEFQHKVFGAPGGYFSHSRASKQVFFNLKIGEMQAKLEVTTLAAEFGIALDSPDGELLALVEKGIAFVGEIRP